MQNCIIYIYKVLIFVCLSVCLFVSPIYNSGTPEPICLNFDLWIGRPTGMFLAWFKDSKLSARIEQATLF